MKKSPSFPGYGCTLMAFGAHPDDIELSVGGTICKIAKAGHRAVAAELTGGESGTRGSARTRLQESRKAAKILGLAERENLGFPDASLEVSMEARRAVARAIRRHRPEIVLAPFVEDLHPDHAAAGRIVRAGFFDARLGKLDIEGDPWFARLLLFYPCRQYFEPTVVVDVTDVYKVKRRAFSAHRSQMGGRGKRNFRPPGVVDPFVMIEARDRHNGSLVGVEYGEGLISPFPLPLSSLSRLCCDPHSRSHEQKR